jgi:predicted acylesterase/phospholipase RssA
MANAIFSQPSKVIKVKYLKSYQKKLELNQALIDKNRKLLGLKGYYTDIAESVANNITIISRFHDLFKIEQAFSVSKTDLETRPIFHFYQEPIQLHMLICFMALALSKHIEISSGLSIRAFLNH